MLRKIIKIGVSHPIDIFLILSIGVLWTVEHVIS
jgi:hypothetical protein